MRHAYLSRGRICRPSGETVEEQARRAATHGGQETSSRARLNAVWAEHDRQIEQRLGGQVEMTYRFACQHCGSRFSLEQQKDDHETECGKVGSMKQPVPRPENESGPRLQILRRGSTDLRRLWPSPLGGPP